MSLYSMLKDKDSKTAIPIPIPIPISRKPKNIQPIKKQIIREPIATKVSSKQNIPEQGPTRNYKVNDPYDPNIPNEFDRVKEFKMREKKRKRKDILTKAMEYQLSQNKSNMMAHFGSSKLKSKMKSESIPSQSLSTNPVKIDLNISADEVYLRRLKMSMNQNTEKNTVTKPKDNIPQVLILLDKTVNTPSLYDDICVECEKYGPVMDCKILETEKTLRIFVEFEFRADAETAVVHMHGKLFKSVPMLVKFS
ncbi:hypothetical protein BC833DRAFT_598912 [Globomyces pollinis-pini]|nr:hypothetical protein BC833DRAFT_598912 [Globomyces pollinis-pini]